MQSYLATVNPNDPGPAGGYALFRRYWRWAEPDEGFGVSGGPNNKYRPDNEGVDWPTTTVTAGNNAGNNDELFSFHPGGVNILFGDGHVAFLKDSISPVTLRNLVTLAGGEVVSSDQY
jgi:prepilin-type processing-associated H-X9-DG protein